MKYKDLEYKTVQVSAVEKGQDGYGSLTGRGNSIFTVDRYGDVAIGYKNLDSLKKDGFLTDTHGLTEGEMGNYTYKGQYGTIDVAKQDAEGLFVKTDFYKDEESQKLRSRVEDRFNRGKGVYFSIGWKNSEAPIILYPSQYKSELPKHVPEDKVNSIIEQAKGLARIRLIVPEVKEIALAPTPVDKNAAVESYKNMKEIQFENSEFKAEFLGAEIEDYIGIQAIESLYYKMRGVLYKFCGIPQWGDIYTDLLPSLENEDLETEQVCGAIDEFAVIAKAIFTKMQELEADSIPDDELDIAKSLASEDFKAVWTKKYQDSLPDSSFAYIEKNGDKTIRHFPYKDKNGKPDAAHVRNALARITQSKVSEAGKASALKKIKSAAKKLGIDSEQKSLIENNEFKAGAAHSKATKEKFKDVMTKAEEMKSAAKEHYDAMCEKADEVYDCMKSMSGDDTEPDDDEGQKAFLDSMEASILEERYRLILTQN